MIYFVKLSAEDGTVKIGRSRNVKRRLSELQVGSPTPCVLLGVTEGGAAEERALHRKFAHLRLREGGEWFRGAKALLEYIAANARPLRPEDHPPPPAKKPPGKPGRPKTLTPEIVRARVEGVIAAGMTWRQIVRKYSPQIHLSPDTCGRYRDLAHRPQVVKRRTGESERQNPL